MNLVWIILFVVLPRFAFAAQDLPADYRSQTITAESPLILEYSFGPDINNKAQLQVINYPAGASDLFFFHMHINETDAKAAGEEAVAKIGGTFMALHHFSGARNMRVKIGTRTYEFDPNRIFTANGLLERTQPRPTPQDLAELQKFVDWVKRNIRLGIAQRSRPMVTALHNNTDDDTHGPLLSILTEKELLGIDNQDVHANPTWDIDNFYIATLPSTYQTLVGATSPNISLRLPRPRDIGYLSNWMILDRIEYINVETQIGRPVENLKMVEDIQTLFH